MPSENAAVYPVNILHQGILLGLTHSRILAQYKEGLLEPAERIKKLIANKNFISESLIKQIEEAEKMTKASYQNPNYKDKRKAIDVRLLDLHFNRKLNAVKQIKVEGKPATALIDSGAMANLVRSDFVPLANLQPTQTKLRSVCDESLKLLGEAYLNVNVWGYKTTVLFMVTESMKNDCILETPFLLDNKVSIHFARSIETSTNELLSKAKDLRISIKQLIANLCKPKKAPVVGAKCEILTQGNTVIVSKPQTIPQALEQMVNEQIAILEQKGYITESHSLWCNKLRPVEKAKIK